MAGKKLLKNKDRSNGVALLVRMSWEEHVALTKLAKEAGVTRAAWLRAKIQRAGKVPGEKRTAGVGRPAGEE